MKRHTLSLFLALALTACGSSEDEPNPNGDTGTGETDAADTTPQDVDTDADTDAGDGDTGEDDAEPGDTDTDTVDEIIVPASSVINEYRTHANPPRADEAFLSKETAYFRVGHELGTGQPLALQQVDAQIWLGTETGLYLYDRDTGAFEPWPDAPTGAYSFIGAATVSWNDVETLVTVVDGVLTLVGLDNDYNFFFPGVESAIHAVVFDGEKFWAATDEGIWQLDSTGDWAARVIRAELEISDIALGPDGRILFSTNEGFFIYNPTDSTVSGWQTERSFRSVDWCTDGRYVVAGENDLVVRTTGFETIVAGAGGLPAGNNLKVRCDNGHFFVGHEIGASLIGGPSNLHEHYTSMRWMLGSRALDVLLEADGTRWILSTDGVTRIDRVPRTLGENAAWNHEQLDEFRRLGGFITASRRLMDWFSLEDAYLRDDDNDGQWTQGMVGAWMFAYGVTGDEAYCDAARLTMDNMLKLLDYPCYSFEPLGRDCGFVARSYVRDDEGAIYEDKEPLSNWIPIEPGDGHTYRWKNDTSSDEVDGHNFGFPLYYDFCATDEEKVTITAAYTRMIDYIINNDYLFIDLSGEKTTYGHWNPERISSCVDGFAQCLRNVNNTEICATACFGGGYLNGMQILGGLLAAWHMSGNEFYYLEYERLIREHRYDEVITDLTDVHTLHSWPIENHSDHELMMLAYHTLIRYEPNPERLARWQAAMLEMYETERIERQPMWVAFVAGLTGEVLDLDEALDSLQRYPRDRREWRYDNSHRADITPVSVLDRRDNPQMEEILPYDEMGYLWWNSNPHRMIHGGGLTEVAPTAYLIAYWSLRYYGLLGEEP